LIQFHLVKIGGLAFSQWQHHAKQQARVGIKCSIKFLSLHTGVLQLGPLTGAYEVFISSLDAILCLVIFALTGRRK